MKIKSKIMASLTLLTMMFFTGCSLNPSKDAVITVNNIPITKQEYQKEFDKLADSPMFKQMGVNLKDNQDDYVGLMLKDKLVNELIVRALLEEAYKKNNIKVSNEDIENELKTIIDKVGSKDKFNELLKQNGVTANQFKKDLKEEIKIKNLVNQISMINITDEMTRKFYNSNLKEFKYPDKVRASHILISTDTERIKEQIKSKEENKNMSEEELDKAVQSELAARAAKAQKIYNELKADPTKFATVAKEVSDDPGSASQGGDLGYFAKEEMVPEFSKAAFSAKPSVITGPIKSDYGWHIILVKDRIAAGTEPYDKVKNEIKIYLDNQERIKVLQTYLENAKKTAKIQYEDESFNPEEIQKKIKEVVKNNPQLQNLQKPNIRK
jgi:parvulin-like peptidyl-prolyl isomerase